MTPVGGIFETDGKSVRPELFGDGFYVVADLGCETAGFLFLDVDTDAGVVIDIGHAEHWENGRIRTHIGTRNFAGRYRTRGGRQTFFRWERRMAGRYVQLHVRGVRTHFALNCVTVRPAELPLTERPVRMMEDGWSRMLNSGATSFWEMREGWAAFNDAGSLCHGWSAVPVYVYGRYPDVVSSAKSRDVVRLH